MDLQSGGQQQFNSSSVTGLQNYNPGVGSYGMKIRLDPAEILRDLELYLRSAKIVSSDDRDGNYTEQVIQVARPMANEGGVQQIMGYLRFTISPQNVQGNLSWDRYDRLIFEISTDIATTIMTNRRNWDIRIEDYDILVNSIMHTVQMFISRLVDNKERESYTESMRTEERSLIKPEKKEGMLSGLFS